jgi:hypothetical protein
MKLIPANGSELNTALLIGLEDAAKLELLIV